MKPKKKRMRLQTKRKDPRKRAKKSACVCHHPFKSSRLMTVRNRHRKIRSTDCHQLPMLNKPNLKVPKQLRKLQHSVRQLREVSSRRQQRLWKSEHRSKTWSKTRQSRASRIRQWQICSGQGRHRSEERRVGRQWCLAMKFHRLAAWASIIWQARTVIWWMINGSSVKLIRSFQTAVRCRKTSSQEGLTTTASSTIKHT